MPSDAGDPLPQLIPYGSPQGQSVAAMYQQRVPLTAQQEAEQQAYKALQNYAEMQYLSRNLPLFYDQAFANNALQFDTGVLQRDTAFDRARLANAQYRDVDLARMNAADQLEAARRGVNSRILTMNDAFTVDMRRIADQIAAADRDYALGMDAATMQNRSQLRDVGNMAAASGAGSSTGMGNMLGTVRDQDMLTRRGLGNTLRDASDLNRSRTETAQAGYDAANRSVMDDWSTAQADNTARMKFIDSVARDYGISRQQMEQALRDGMQRLQMDYATTTRKIQDAITSNDSMATAAGEAALNQILMASMGRV